MEEEKNIRKRVNVISVGMLYTQQNPHVSIYIFRITSPHYSITLMFLVLPSMKNSIKFIKKILNENISKRSLRLLSLNHFHRSEIASKMNFTLKIVEKNNHKPQRQSITREVRRRIPLFFV